MRPEKDRVLAESLFVCEGKSGREIAALLGAGKETVQRWAREGKWTQRRRRRRLESPLASLELLKRERDRLIQTFGSESPPKPDAINAVQKLTQTIEKMESRQEEAIGPMLDTMGRFGTFVVTHAAADDCAAVRTWIENFLNEERRRSI